MLATGAENSLSHATQALDAFQKMRALDPGNRRLAELVNASWDVQVDASVIGWFVNYEEIEIGDKLLIKYGQEHRKKIVLENEGLLGPSAELASSLPSSGDEPVPAKIEGESAQDPASTSQSRQEAPDTDEHGAA